jgi:hypothetical protein
MKLISAMSRMTAVVLLALCFDSAQAQVLYGTLVGTVEDSSGAVVPNADVTVASKTTGVTRQVKSDAAGLYSVPNLVPGMYDVKVGASGFKTVNRTNFDVTAGSIVRADVRMEVGQISEQITVEASATQVQVDRADVKSEIATKAIEVLPMNIYRNYQAIINLVPGTTPAGFQNSSTDTPGRSLTTNVNGTARNMNVTRVDGAVSINIWLPHHTGYTPPSETVETVSVGTGSLDAEQGMAGGAAIGVTSRGGTNDFRAAAWWYHTQRALRARNFFQRNRDVMPFFNNNIPGVRAGGAIIKNKLFYFGHFEQTRERVGGFVPNLSLPTQAVRTGNFSGISTAIFDPATSTDATARTQFAGNVIPANRISPITNRILALVPNPTRSTELQNFDAGATGIFDRWNYDFKGNYNLTEKTVMWAKYSRFKGLVTGKGAFGELVGPSAVQDPGTGDTVVHVPSIGGSHTFSPTFVMDAVFGINWQDQTVQAVDFGTNYGTDVFRIPGTNGPDLRYSGLPAFSFTGYSPYGLTQAWMPLFRNDRSYTFSTNFTKTMGRHEIRFGYDMVHHQLNHWQPEIANPRGAFSFNGQLTARQGGVAPNNFNSFADFLLGEFSGASKSFQFEVMTGREWQHGWYVRDRWQISRKLTLNVGLRLEHYPLMTRANTGLERLELFTQRVVLGGRGNTPTNAGISVKNALWAPRIGLAYRIQDDFVVRAGYGLTYDPLPFSRPLRGFYPLTISQSLVQPAAFQRAGTLATGIPAFNLPDVSQGAVQLPTTVDMRTPGERINRGYIQSWNLTLEKKLPLDVVTSVAYVGTQSTNMLADLNVNAAGPGSDVPGLPYNIAFGRRISLLYWDGWLSSNYHSMQVAFNRNFKNGLFIKGAYTWSRAMNMTDDNGWTGVNFNWVPWLRRNYAQAGYNRPHNWQTAVIYDLPFGKGKSFAQSGIAAAVLGGWQVNTVMYRFSGSPFTVGADGSALLAPGNIQTANQVKSDVQRLGAFGPGTPYFDPTAFAQPTGRGVFGNTGRNLLRGPHVIGMDGGIFRSFSLANSADKPMNLQFKAEAFNLTNTPRFGNPSTAVQVPATFMQITGTRFDSDRIIRFGLKLEY